MSQDRKAVLVTTENRGVFFGYLIADESPERVILSGARNCVYWSSDVRGFLGLAATGPTQYCKIGPSVPELILLKITSITVCAMDAITAWEKAPWNS